MPYRSKQMSESMPLAVLLTLAGGFQDAYSYNCRGQVFANAQTGNIVLLGQNLAAGNFSYALRYLFPLLAFFTGVYLTEWLRQKCRNIRRLHWRQIILLTEIILLLVAGGLPQSLNISANVLLSFACAMQVSSFRKFRGIPCATTMCIGNMRAAAECLCRYRVAKDKEAGRQSLHYFLILLIFAAGASMGAVLSQLFGNPSIWIAAAFQFAGFILMFIKEDIETAGRE
ncbi:MAG: YoaK family protein [Candidatus Howiella sp.]